MASTPSFTFFCCYLLVVSLLVGFLFQQVSWCSQLPPTCLIFQCPLQFLVSNPHICWDTIGCWLCSSLDWLGVSPVCRGKWTLLLPISLPSSFSSSNTGNSEHSKPFVFSMNVGFCQICLSKVSSVQ